MAETPNIVLPEKMNNPADEAARSNLRQAAKEARDALASRAGAVTQEAAKPALNQGIAADAERAAARIAEKAAAERVAGGLSQEKIAPEVANARIEAAAKEGKAAIDAAKNSKNIVIANGVAEGPKHTREFLEQASKHARQELESLRSSNSAASPHAAQTAEAAERAAARITQKAAAERGAVHSAATSAAAAKNAAGAAESAAASVAQTAGKSGPVAQAAAQAGANARVVINPGVQAAAGAAESVAANAAQTAGKPALKPTPEEKAARAVGEGERPSENLAKKEAEIKGNGSTEPAKAKSAAPKGPSVKTAAGAGVLVASVGGFIQGVSNGDSGGDIAAGVAESGTKGGGAGAAFAKGYQWGAKVPGPAPVKVIGGAVLGGLFAFGAERAIDKGIEGVKGLFSSDNQAPPPPAAGASAPIPAGTPAERAASNPAPASAPQAAPVPVPAASAASAPAPAASVPAAAPSVPAASASGAGTAGGEDPMDILREKLAKKLGAAPAAKTGDIIVQKDDSLSLIAQKDDRLKEARAQVKAALGDGADNLTVTLVLSMAIAKKSGIEKPDMIHPGKVLTIPNESEIKDVANKLKLTEMMKADSQNGANISGLEFKQFMKGKTTSQILG